MILLIFILANLLFPHLSEFIMLFFVRKYVSNTKKHPKFFYFALLIFICIAYFSLFINGFVLSPMLDNLFITHLINGLIGLFTMMIYYSFINRFIINNFYSYIKSQVKLTKRLPN